MKILSHENLNGWYPVKTDSIKYEILSHCPACQIPLNIIAVIKGKKFVRIGGCDFCGYMGYIDRPTPAWFSEFYTEKWDVQGKNNQPDITRENFAALKPNSLYVMLKSIKGPGRFLEIGCGFGYNLLGAEQLKREAIGVEGSNHRAEACEKLGFKVYRGNFEELDIKERFEIVAHHQVLEHVRDPNLFIKKCADIQQKGDYMIISVPNNIGEPTMGVLMYLPHIHSFTVASLQRLLGKHGYEIKDYTLTNKNHLNIIAQKLEKPLGTIKIQGFMRDGVNKLFKGLDFKKKWFNPKQRLIWSKFEDNAKQLSLREKPKGFKEERSLIIKQDKMTFPIIIESEFLFVK